MQIRCYSDDELSPAMRSDIARYRYRVFVAQLRWDLPVPVDHDQDEFDTCFAMHVVATQGGAIVGYARLIPTTRPYVLQTHFPSLLNGCQPPCSPTVWELSRFAATDLRRQEGANAVCARAGKAVLLESLTVAAENGATSLIFCTTVAIERLSLRWGLRTARLGPPMRSAAGLLVAADIECSSANRIVLMDGALSGLARGLHGAVHERVAGEGCFS